MCVGKIGMPRGYTLVEMLLSMLCLSLLAVWSVAAVQEVMQQSRIVATSNSLLGLVEHARHSALALNRAVTLCSSVDALLCSTDRGGYVLLFEDANRNGRIDGGERVIASHRLFQDQSMWLVWRGFRQKDYLTWAPGGRTDSMNGTYTLCNRAYRDKWLRQVVINRAGRARVVRPAVAGGVQLASARMACGG